MNMLKFLGFTCLVMVLMLSPRFVFAQLDDVHYNWEEKRNKKGVTIETSKVAGSKYRAVRGEMTVKGSVSSLIALVEDLENCSKWADLCKESRVEKRISDSESYAYVYNDLPFPVSDRDVYTHVEWHQNDETGRVTMTSRATSGGTTKTKAVRIENAVSQWHFTPQQDGTTLVESFAHIDPNGPTPAWITNMMLIDSPYKSMMKMRSIVESGDYADAVIPFLAEN